MMGVCKSVHSTTVGWNQHHEFSPRRVRALVVWCLHMAHGTGEEWPTGSCSPSMNLRNLLVEIDKG